MATTQATGLAIDARAVEGWQPVGGSAGPDHQKVDESQLVGIVFRLGLWRPALTTALVLPLDLLTLRCCGVVQARRTPRSLAPG